MNHRLLQNTTDPWDDKDKACQMKRDKCNLCNWTFQVYNEYVHHIMECHNDVTEPTQVFKDPWRCVHCDSWFDGSRRLLTHVREQHQQVASAAANKTATATRIVPPPPQQQHRTEANGHSSCSDGQPRTINSKLVGNVCKFCQRYVRPIAAHMIRVHRVSIPIISRVCLLCFTICDNANNLRIHMQSVHMVQNYKYDDSEKCTDFTPSPVLGINVAPGTREFFGNNTEESKKCKISKNFSVRRTNSPRNFKMSTAWSMESRTEFVINRARELLRPQSNVAVEKPDSGSSCAPSEIAPRYTCYMCGMVFAHRILLTSHKHHWHDPLMCPKCGVYLFGISALAVHNRTAHSSTDFTTSNTIVKFTTHNNLPKTVNVVTLHSSAHER